MQLVLNHACMTGMTKAYFCHDCCLDAMTALQSLPQVCVNHSVHGTQVGTEWQVPTR